MVREAMLVAPEVDDAVVASALDAFRSSGGGSDAGSGIDSGEGDGPGSPIPPDVDDRGAQDLGADDRAVDDLAPGAWCAGPDALGEVLEAEAMVAVFAAQRLVRIERMHRAALSEEPARYGAQREIAERSVRLELAAGLRVTETMAASLIELACAVVNRYPAAWESLAGARTTERHVRALVELVDKVPGERRDEVAARAAAWAEELPYGTFRRRLGALVETVRAETLVERYREAVGRRCVLVEPADDGMAFVGALVPAVEAHAIHGRVTAIAKRLVADDGETRTLEQARADVFCDLLMDGATGHLRPADSGIRPTVMVTVPALALLHDTDARKAPASVEGIGPISVERARELCGDQSEWTRILTHPETGIVLSVGRRRYRAPEPLRRLVQWRADRCMAPGCRVPASRCEIDHTVAWADGGQTNLDNHAPLCTGHHTIKHHGGWRVRQLPGQAGAIEWTSPTGRVYTVDPERHVPAFRPDGDAPPDDAGPPGDASSCGGGDSSDEVGLSGDAGPPDGDAESCGSGDRDDDWPF